MGALRQDILKWAEEAKAKLREGNLTEADVDALTELASRPRTVRQRLLYLHAATPNIQSQTLAMALHEPVKGDHVQIEPTEREWPYRTVKDAVVDGWQIIHFPDQRAPFDDKEIDLLGYEFTLQKMEEYDG